MVMGDSRRRNLKKNKGFAIISFVSQKHKFLMGVSKAFIVEIYRPWAIGVLASEYNRGLTGVNDEPIQL